MKKYIVKGTVWFVALWVIFSFTDYHFARTMYGGMELSPLNLLVVLFNLFDNLLQGFMF